MIQGVLVAKKVVQILAVQEVMKISNVPVSGILLGKWVEIMDLALVVLVHLVVVVALALHLVEILVVQGLDVLVVLAILVRVEVQDLETEILETSLFGDMDANQSSGRRQF